MRQQVGCTEDIEKLMDQEEPVISHVMLDAESYSSAKPQPPDTTNGKIVWVTHKSTGESEILKTQAL
jgi:hypothetical protein